MLLRSMLFAGSVLALSACTSISPKECALSDWEQFGYNDALRGDDMRVAQSKREKSCVKKGIVPDRVAYNRGFDRGLVGFCTPSNGYQLGKNGYRYRGICAAHNEVPFLAEYQLGFEHFELRSDVANAESRLNDARYRRDHAEEMIMELRAEMVLDGVRRDWEIYAETIPDYYRYKEQKQQAEADMIIAEQDLLLARDAMQDFLLARADDRNFMNKPVSIRNVSN